MAIPIIFIHKGDCDYLAYSLTQAKHFNPDSKIFLIGDKENSHYKFVNHINISDYFTNGKEFEKIYKHLSTLSRKFELFCIQRWFILKDFMSANNINKCVYIDSDVLLYSNITEEQKKFEQFDFALSGISGHTCFINNIEGLTKFCDFVTCIYNDASQLEYLEKFVLHLVKNELPGGICDMILFSEYAKRNRDRIGENFQIIDASIFDHTINTSDGFEMKNKIKNICFKNNIPYCKHLETNKDIKFNSLHLQGEAKELMPIYHKGNKIAAEMYCFLYKFKNKVIKLRTIFN
ncbi:MAG: hypothetical protein ACD_20C00434G0011 [uncultured bacterium]|nr:MAG: hypothetical protein ACD_20C00434G0011 [uncultured bacterium]